MDARSIRAVLAAGVALAAAATAPLSAQSAARDPTRAVWVSGGLGRTIVQPSGSDSSWVAASADVNVQRGDWLVQVRGQFWGALEGASVAEFGVLFGRAARSGVLSLAAAAGFGGIHMDRGDGRSSLTGGMPFMARAALRPLPVLGLGVQFVANVNSRQSVAAWQLVVEVGKVR